MRSRRVFAVTGLSSRICFWANAGLAARGRRARANTVAASVERAPRVSPVWRGFIRAMRDSLVRVVRTWRMPGPAMVADHLQQLCSLDFTAADPECRGPVHCAGLRLTNPGSEMTQ